MDRSHFKHVCKLCFKRYPSGKSLGGHMRSHVIANAKALLANKAQSFLQYHSDHDHDEDDDVDQDGGSAPHSGYRLRENPKKTRRGLNDHDNSFLKEQEIRVCKQCGKAFQSVKALCGHMSSHSDRERAFKYVVDDHDDDQDDDQDDDHSWSSDTHNNNIILSSKIQTRSSYSRYSSENDQHQQEEVAVCLMMLSRDHHHHHHHSSNSSPQSKSFNFGPESSDNNSVILEGGSSSNHLGGIIMGKTKDFNFVNNNKFKEVGKSQKVNVCEEMDNSDSGYFENGAKELESDASVDGFFVKNYYYYSNYNQFGSDEGSKKRVSSFESPESEGNYSSKKVNSNSQKVSKFECGKCHQTFKTYQALGGHIISSHRKNGTHENTLEDPNFAKKGAAKKAKGHKCPYCPRVFKSGQALGGHKRSHMMGGGHRGRAPPLDPEPEASPPPPPPPPMIDLNLPAPLDEEEVEGEASGNSEFVAW